MIDSIEKWMYISTDMNQMTDSIESGCGSVIPIPKSGCMALLYGLVKASHENRRHGRSQELRKVSRTTLTFLKLKFSNRLVVVW